MLIQYDFQTHCVVFLKAIIINFYHCAFCGRYYDQLEAMEGKLPISESQVRFTESQSWSMLDSVVVVNFITDNSCCFVNSVGLVSFTNCDCIKHFWLSQGCVKFLFVIFSFCYRSESHLLGMMHLTKDRCLGIGRAVSDCMFQTTVCSSIKYPYSPTEGIGISWGVGFCRTKNREEMY